MDFWNQFIRKHLKWNFEFGGIPYEREKELGINYKGNKLEKKFCADFVCYGKVIVELKALSKLTGDHEAQIINYLKATKSRLGLLINFGSLSLEHKRYVNL
jgi:GxxExxY protein